MTATIPEQRMAAGYGAGAPDRDRRKLMDRARGFKPNPRMESLAKLRADDPAAFGRLPAQTRMGLFYYEQAKQAAAAAEEDKGDA